MRLKLTDMAVQKLNHPEKGQIKYWDTVVPGFGVRVTKGTKAFFVSHGTDRRIVTLGKYPTMSLRMARDEAQRFKLGYAPTTRLESFTEARTAFLADAEARLRPSTVTMYRTYLHQVTAISLTDIGRNDIDTNHPQTVASWKAFFNWCIRQELTEKNPFAFVKAQTNQRDRVLASDELRQVWSYNFSPFSSIVKLLLLTGLRRMEVINLELVDDTFVLAPEHTKNGRGHTIPATEWAQSIYRPFSFNGWSKGKKRLDQNVHIPHWTLHDLRRTFATIHARIGTPIHVVEALLNHQSGTISGISAVYIRHNFMLEAEKALACYENELQSIVA